MIFPWDSSCFTLSTSSLHSPCGRLPGVDGPLELEEQEAPLLLEPELLLVSDVGCVVDEPPWPLNSLNIFSARSARPAYSFAPGRSYICAQILAASEGVLAFFSWSMTPFSPVSVTSYHMKSRCELRQSQSLPPFFLIQSSIFVLRSKHHCTRPR